MCGTPLWGALRSRPAGTAWSPIRGVVGLGACMSPEYQAGVLSSVDGPPPIWGPVPPAGSAAGQGRVDGLDRPDEALGLGGDGRLVPQLLHEGGGSCVTGRPFLGSSQPDRRQVVPQGAHGDIEGRQRGG